MTKSRGPIVTGYDDVHLEPPAGPPEKATWAVEIDTHSHVASGKTYARLLIDGESCGFMRLPSPEYLKYLRQALELKREDHECASNRWEGESQLACDCHTRRGVEP